MKLTDHVARTVALSPAATDRKFFDDDLPGFGVRVRAGGSRKWIVQYDGAGGATRRMTLGNVGALTAAKARTMARDILAAVRLGKDPAGEKAETRARAGETIGAILPGYLEHKRAETKSNTLKLISAHLKVHASPLHRRPIHSVTLREAALFLTKIAEERGKVARNRVRSTLKAFYAWALREGLVEVNPFVNTNLVAENDARSRTPSIEELAEIWHAAGDTRYGLMVRLLMLTGARRDEIASLCKSEVNLDAGLITLPPERTKNGRTHEIPITPTMARLIRAALELNGGDHDHVFGRAGGGNGLQSYSNLKAALDERIAMARKARGAEPMLAFVLHDFRRSMSSTMHETLGVAPHIVEACLGHVSGFKSGIAGVYNTASYRNEKRRALELWNDLLMTAVDGGKNKIVRLKRG